MEPFKIVKGLVVPLDRSNVDTDAIIPKQFLKSIKRSGFGPNLFDEWRYLDRGEPDADNSQRPLNSDFVLNQPRYQGGQILLTRENFGCGSSREHAPWALLDYGFRVIVASGYADIFYNNCFKNGILPIVQSAAVIDQLFTEVDLAPGYVLSIDLDAQSITTPAGEVLAFDVDPFRKHCLINGLDDIALTLQRSGDISAYVERRQQQVPWLFAD
ncbi:MAG: 3-isopropylmalate dehydratase small subunit [Gammaproteobacteria bacterium]|nr:3-isopropylmalate dehydratase small subunit [Gammaproteobacteria bacterium]